MKLLAQIIQHQQEVVIQAMVQYAGEITAGKETYRSFVKSLR